MKITAAVICGCLLSGCMTVPNLHKFTPIAPKAVVDEQLPASMGSGAIYRAGQEIRLFEDRTARRVGDVLTIRLVERTNASKRASSTVDKNSLTDLPNPTLFGKSVDFGNDYNLEMRAGGTRDFEGGGQSDQSNSLSGEISAIVVHVFPNGNLMVRGEKMVTINQGEEYVQIAGVVRVDDIFPDNSVLSTRVADAQIIYGGTGALADANAAGWLQRFFFSPIWPY